MAADAHPRAGSQHGFARPAHTVTMAARKLPAPQQAGARPAGNDVWGSFPAVRALLCAASLNQKTSLVAELEKVDLSGLVGVALAGETVEAFAKRCVFVLHCLRAHAPPSASSRLRSLRFLAPPLIPCQRTLLRPCYAGTR
jgi:hypothetical protein